MSHVLLVEPDDDFCLFLSKAISGADCHISITGSNAGAREILDSSERLECVVTDAHLPDGSGLLLARDAVQMGKQVFVLRPSRGRIEVCDRQGIVFKGSQFDVGTFLKKAVLRRAHGKATERILLR